MSCKENCNCNRSSGDAGYQDETTLANSGPRYRQSNCWGVVSGEAVVAAGAAIGGATGILITLPNYAWLKPRVLRLSAVDPDTGASLAGAITLTRVEGLGRNVLGSDTLNGGAADVYAQRGLRFGGDISEITASNRVIVTGVNNSTKSLRIAIFIEGEAAQ